MSPAALLFAAMLSRFRQERPVDIDSGVVKTLQRGLPRASMTVCQPLGFGQRSGLTRAATPGRTSPLR
jgi:hypothetical protein